jgi:hypothetical protein
MARRHSGPAARDELAPGMLMRALGVGVEDEGAAAGERADPAPSAVRARLAVAAVIAGTALLAGVLGPSAGAGRYSGESGANVRAAAGVNGLVETQGDSFVKTKKFGSDVVLGAAAAAAVSMSALAGDAVQWRVEDGGNGHWYSRFVSPIVVTWPQARNQAATVGGHLATISNSNENEFVFQASRPSLWSNRFGPWIGAFRLPDSGELGGAWAWVTGEPWTYTAWEIYQPDNGCLGDESAIHFINYTNSWNDLSPTGACDSEKCFHFMVEWEADCNSDGIVDYGQCHDGTLPDYNGNNIPDCCEQGVQCTVGNYPMQWRVEDGGNGHWYLAVHPSPMPATFAAQDAFADSVGAHMATLTSSDENVFAISLLSGAAGEINGAHFGLRRVGDTTSWQWVGGEPLTWDFWGSISCSGGPYPNNSGTGGEMGAMLYKQNCGWVWDDAWPSYYAGELTLMLLIEWSADCNNDNIVDYGQILNGQLPDTNANNTPDGCEPGNSCCLGDIYENHIVDGGDLGVLLSEWGIVTPTTNSDLNRDGFVNGADLGMLLANWGPCGG